MPITLVQVELRENYLRLQLRVVGIKKKQLQWKKRSERRKHCARAGCSKVRTPPARCHKPTDRTDYNTLRRS